MPNWPKVFKSRKEKEEKRGEPSRRAPHEEDSGLRRRCTDGPSIAPDEGALMDLASRTVHESRVPGRRGDGKRLLEEEEERRRRRPSNESLILGGEHRRSHENARVGVHTDSEGGHDDHDLLAAADDAIDSAYGFGPGHKKMPNYSLFPPRGRSQPPRAPSSKEEIEALRAKALRDAARRRRRHGDE